MNPQRDQDAGPPAGDGSNGAAVPHPFTAARYGTYEQFRAALKARPQANPTDYFLSSLQNEDPAARFEISMWLLDQGADATQRVPAKYGRNALDYLFWSRRANIPVEAALLKRLLDAGVDINARHNGPDYTRVPLEALYYNDHLDDSELGPWYDVIFAQPYIDWDNRSEEQKEHPSFPTLGYRLAGPDSWKPEMGRRMLHYMVYGPTPLP